MNTEVHIDKEFAALCPPLTLEERNLLEASVTAHGCRDPLTVWQENGKPLVLDGHNRLEICKRFRVEYKTRPIKFESRDEARNWVINNQLGRRNVTEDQKSYLRGKRYIAEKNQGARFDLTCGQSGHKSPGRTRDQLAEEYGVGSRTIDRDAKFAKAVDTLAANTGETSRRAILSGELHVSKQDIVKLAELPPGKQLAVVMGGADKIRKATGGTPSRRKPKAQPQRFNEAAFLPLCDQINDWITQRFDKAGGAEARDECAKLLGQLQRRIEQWQRHKPL